MMTIAKNILDKTKNSDCQSMEAFYLAENQGEADQLWDEEATMFTFDDGSKLKFSCNFVEEIH